jgi:tetratricopeptide (TPR) repeat protein
MEPTLSEPTIRATAVSIEADVARLHGKLREAKRQTERSIGLYAQAGARGGLLNSAVAEAIDAAWVLGDSTRAARLLDDALARDPIDKLSMTEAPYVETVGAYAFAGRVDRANAMLSQWDARRRTSPTTQDSARAHAMRGVIALQSKQYGVAQTELHAADEVGCAICEAALLARAYDLDGKADSAIAVYERYIDTPILERSTVDGLFLPAVHKRLGELYEARGERDKAVQHYRTFIALWKDADPELQPKVTDARQRLAALLRGTDTRR